MTDWRVKKVQHEPVAADGYRVLVDRLWPRGTSKERAQLAEWAKEVAPSTELRTWVHADLDGRWAEFSERYRADLATGNAAAALLRRTADQKVVTLLVAAHDEQRNHALILREVLRELAD
ncbi:DUF488 family protein [Naumannella sp. ID2617S]|nr:DUF488 family protein [Naumannella sp. ID2617S]